MRAGIIGHLRSAGPATRGEIAAALNLGAPTVAAALRPMVQAGLLLTDPPLGEVQRGQRPRYSVNHERVSRMYLQLGQAIGEL